MTPQRIQTVKRLVHYYNLLVGYAPNYQLKNVSEPFHDVFEAILKEINNDGVFRYMPYADKTFVIPEISINQHTGFIQGKLFAIRGEDFPEVYNLTTALTRDFDAADNEGLVETSHFVINYKKLHPTVAFEYNQYGAKITDLARYLGNIAQQRGIANGIIHQHIVRDQLSTFIDRMGRYSKLEVKVHRDQVDRLRNIEGGLATVFEQTFEEFEGEYADFEIKFDLKSSSPASKASGLVKRLIGQLLRNPQNAGVFNILSVTAEDKDINNRLQAFDLLVDKVKSELIVQKKSRSRTILSGDILHQMHNEMIRLDIG